jgi:excisionase family DNA binding protein
MSALTFELPDSVIEQIAQRAAALLADNPQVAVEPWLTVDQAAAHLGISVSQLYSLSSQRHRNGLPVTKEGSRSYFKASQLDTWRASR